MPRQTIPTRLIIPPFEFEVHTDKQRIMNEEHRVHQGIWGYANSPQLEIGIDPDQKEARQMQTYLHETFHMILESAGYNHPKKIKTGEDWEELLTVISSGMLSFFQMNETSVRWLAGMEEAAPTTSMAEEVTLKEGEVFAVLNSAEATVLEGTVLLQAPMGKIYIPQESTNAESHEADG